MATARGRLVLLALLPAPFARAYCTPKDACWPAAERWRGLEGGLSKEAQLHALSLESLDACFLQGNNAIGLVDEGHGACMQDNACLFDKCTYGNAWNVAAYSVQVRTVADIQAALAFANTHNVSVSVKTSGHSYAGSSSMKGSLQIYMSEFEKYGEVATVVDTCGTSHDHVLKIGGGQPWGDAYAAVAKAGREIVGGGGLTVSAAGGWLMGGGLSSLSRKYGYGIDNLVAVDVVTAAGDVVKADACSHPDLFWAARGGGGGTFGVLIAAYYRTHEISKVTTLSMAIAATALNVATIGLPTLDSWVDFWVDTSPTIDTNWTGGYWTLSGITSFFYHGTKAEALASDFVVALNAWKAGLKPEHAALVAISLEEFGSYWEFRKSFCALDPSTPACKRWGAQTDATGQQGTNIHSRMIPRSFVEKNGGADAKATLKWLIRNGFDSFNYFLGGAITDVAADATAVHPSVRSSIWNMEVFHPQMIEKLREDIPEAGVCFNHAAKDEPDWETAAWGANHRRLVVRFQPPPSPRLSVPSFPCL